MPWKIKSMHSCRHGRSKGASCQTKSGLISKGILILDPFPTKGAESLPWAENLNFLLLTVNNVFKFSAQGSNLTPFIGNGTKVKIPSEIEPPLSFELCIWESQVIPFCFDKIFFIVLYFMEKLSSQCLIKMQK